MELWKFIFGKKGKKPTANMMDHTTIAKDKESGTLYVLKESSAGVKEVVEIGASGTPANSHARLHSMTDPLDHAAAAEADRNKLVATNASTGAIEYIPKSSVAGTNYWERSGITLRPATSGDKLEIIVTGSNVAIIGSSVDARGVQGLSTNSQGVYGQSTNSMGGYFVSQNSRAIDGNINPTSTNTVVPALLLQRNTSNTAQNGIGISARFNVETTNGTTHEAGDIAFLFTDATTATITSEMRIFLRKNGGNLENAITIKATGEAKALGLYPFPQAIYRQIADRTIANTTTETTMFGSGQGTLTIPANRLEAGTTIRIKMQGYISTPAADENATFKVKYGSTELISISGNLMQSLSNAAIVVDLMMTCRSSGASGKMMAAGVVLIEIRGAGYNAMIRLQNTAEVTVDTTTASVVDVTFKWAAAKEANQLVTNVSTVELI